MSSSVLMHPLEIVKQRFSMDEISIGCVAIYLDHIGAIVWIDESNDNNCLISWALSAPDPALIEPIIFRNANGEFHRDNDLPAVIWANGTKEWFKDGERHRDGDLPAVVYADGSKEWWRNGERHRDGGEGPGSSLDLPAIVWADGSKEWFKDGKLHRDNDLPAIIWANGVTEWWRNGKLHRDNDLPAVIWTDGTKSWWRPGLPSSGGATRTGLMASRRPVR